MNNPWKGRLHHSRELCDDWGCIRDEEGVWIFRAMIPYYDGNHEEVLSNHRRNQTDPTQERVDALLAALNKPESQDVTPDKPGQYWLLYKGKSVSFWITKEEIEVKQLELEYYDACRVGTSAIRFSECRFRPCPCPFEGET